jgi:mRNA interferase MazF
MGRRRFVVLSRDPAIPRLRRTLIGPCEGVSVGTLVERLGRLSDDRMRQICRALAIAVACDG